jgi:DNA-directed RNA polymerase subunit RPC12/RpoP
MADTYTCAACGKTFRKAWSDEEALAELEATFGDLPGVPLEMVCDTCYHELMGGTDDR